MNPVNGGKTQDLAEWMRQSNVNPDNAGVGPALVAKEIDDEISWQVQLIKDYLVKQVQKRDRNDKAAQGKIEGLFGSLNAKECKFLLDKSITALIAKSYLKPWAQRISINPQKRKIASLY